MFELRPPEELLPRLDLDEVDRILIIDGPNLVPGKVEADILSEMELQRVPNSSYKSIFAWFTEPDERHAESIVDQAQRILSPGGKFWLIVPKKNSVEHHKAKGILRDQVLPRALQHGLTQKKTLGIGPHYFAIQTHKTG